MIDIPLHEAAGHTKAVGKGVRKAFERSLVGSLSVQGARPGGARPQRWAALCTTATVTSSLPRYALPKNRAARIPVPPSLPAPILIVQFKCAFSCDDHRSTSPIRSSTCDLIGSGRVRPLHGAGTPIPVGDRGRARGRARASARSLPLLAAGACQRRRSRDRPSRGRV